jgi:hypothetical protein
LFAHPDISVANIIYLRFGVHFAPHMEFNWNILNKFLSLLPLMGQHQYPGKYIFDNSLARAYFSFAEGGSFNSQSSLLTIGLQSPISVLRQLALLRRGRF